MVIHPVVDWQTDFTFLRATLQAEAENCKNLTFKVQISHMGLASVDLYTITNAIIMEWENATAIII